MSDTIMVGRLGVEALAAIAIGILLAEILWETAIPLSAGTQTISSRLHGKEGITPDPTEKREIAEKIGCTLDNAILVALTIGTGAFAIASYSHPLIVSMFGDSPTTALTEAYIQIIKWGIPLFAVFSALLGFFGGINKTKIIMIVVLEMNVLNILISYVLVFGKFGLPALGIEGAAWGTVIASTIGLLHLGFVAGGKNEFKKYRCFRFAHIQLSLVKEIGKLTLPVVLLEVTALATYFIYESFIIKIGVVFLAVTHILLTIFELNKVIIRGYAKSASIFVGNALGRGDSKEALSFAYAGAIISFGFGLISFMSFLFIPEYIIKVFTSDEETISIGVVAFRFFAVFAFLEVIGYCMETIFTHNGWGRYALISEFSTNAIFLIGGTFLVITVFELGIWAAWSAFALYLFFHSTILLVGFFSKRWLRLEISKPC